MLGRSCRTRNHVKHPMYDPRQAGAGGTLVLPEHCKEACVKRHPLGGTSTTDVLSSIPVDISEVSVNNFDD